RVVKGIEFVNLRDVGDPAEMAAAYEAAGADELVFLDITATYEERPTRVDLARRTRQACTIPFAVGGGMKSVDEVAAVLDAGADKVSLGSAAVRDPQLVTAVSKLYGPARLVSATDVRKVPGAPQEKWEVVINGGREFTGIDVVDWARKVVDLGAGSILLTSMDCDGVKDGYDIPLTRAVADTVSVPVTASGGAGKVEDFVEAVVDGHAAAVLAASVFHFGEISVREVKEALRAAGLEVNL
ncbi:MAG: imidazole glycerol phosphate synthase cyclase subunit, partial [Coriobacteriia bacterium]|nr:imidazole glycerol phosphate synthase cyclase subunit [Coriobacteriia bacterium]